ncbi:MAG: 50S ribosomal protein L10 [Thermoplasmata archaeon]|jgi:large subunit ribosomal protein L10|nr:50S ribosomal protein L10 [Thermoplasmata archaeon]MVT12974.1 50S ribosomal protein L10 [Euryarchaeota archaeon]MVT14936.1 50S ribosomal protein L10 [Euryarchaeota archaeon]MVT35208.1 50S ribosomal protein L10 [Euryarchaeota archaeon]
MVSKANEEEVKQLLKEMEEGNVIGIVGIHGIPGTQMNNIRRSLRGNAKLIVSKNTLISIALQDLEGKKKNVKELAKYIKDQSALIVSDKDPFKLAKIVEASRTRASPKGGEIAPEDVVVPAGETEFKPGPIVSDLQKVGIPASIEKGKVVIKKDTVVVKKGEKISKDLAQMLAKLDIRPIPVGLEIRAFYENGYIFGSDALKIDTEKVLQDLKNSIMNAFNLSLNVGYYTKLTIPIMLSDAYMKALSLGININYFTPETIKHLLAKANLQAMTIKEKLGDI